MRTKAFWRKYRRRIYNCADWLLYISGGFSALLLLWIVLQVTTVAHFVVPTGSMEPTLIPGDRILVNKWLMGARIFDVWESAAGKRVEISRLLSDDNPSKEKLLQGGFLDDGRVGWNIGEFGPLYIPKEGSRVDMTVENALVYRKAIEWEQRKKLHIRGDSICLGDSLIREYTFGKNYYFTAGDNVLSSQDSRYWGMLPEEYIVGKATRIFRSINKHTDRERWNRFLKKIE